MTSIELSEKQLPYLHELEGYLVSYEDTMGVDITDTNIINLMRHLKVCQSLIATQARVEELATIIYGHVKGLLIEEFARIQESEHIRDKFYKGMKVHEFRLWADGKMAKWEGLHNKALKAIKSFDKYNDNMRTLISAEKDLAKHLGQQV